MDNSDLKLWPFDEALKVKKRIESQNDKKEAFPSLTEDIE